MFKRISIANRYGAVLKSLRIDRDAIGCANLILSSIPSTNRRLLVIEDVEFLFQRGVDFFGNLGHAILFHQWQYSSLDGCQPWVQSHDGPRLQFAVFVGRFVFVVGLAKEREGCSIRTGGGLNDVRNEAFIG